jgi:hypothetical protein
MTTVEEDALVQEAVLSEVLEQHPTTLTVAEFLREFGPGEGERV